MAEERQVDVVVQIGAEDALAGRLYSHRRQATETASFVYDGDYIRRPDAYALDPQALPLVQGPLQSPLGLPIFRAFADTAPDRWGRSLIKREERRRAQALGRAQRSIAEIDYLLGVRDDLRQGALRFRKPGETGFLADPEAGVPRLTDLPMLLAAARKFELDEESAEELRELLRAGSSLGGVRPKAHVLDKGRLAIAKFPSSSDEWNVIAWEKIALELARAAGIRVPDSQLLEIDGRNVLIVDRFDRQDGARIGYISAMTMLEANDHETFNYVDIAAAIEEQSPQATADLHELWRRAAFNVLISNTDDHLRNHAFVHSGADTWTLSPAFDLNPNPEPGPKLHSTAIIDNDRAAGIDTLLSEPVASLFRLTHDEAIAALAAVVAATDRWREFASTHGLHKNDVPAMEPAFEHRDVETARAAVAEASAAR